MTTPVVFHVPQGCDQQSYRPADTTQMRQEGKSLQVSEAPSRLRRGDVKSPSPGGLGGVSEEDGQTPGRDSSYV